MANDKGYLIPILVGGTPIDWALVDDIDDTLSKHFKKLTYYTWQSNPKDAAQWISERLGQRWLKEGEANIWKVVDHEAGQHVALMKKWQQIKRIKATPLVQPYTKLLLVGGYELALHVDDWGEAMFKKAIEANPGAWEPYYLLHKALLRDYKLSKIPHRLAKEVAKLLNLAHDNASDPYRIVEAKEQLVAGYYRQNGLKPPF